MSIKEKIVSNATFLSLNWVAITFIPIFFWFIVGKTLPPESYGIIATVLQATIFLSFIASFGFPMTIDKLIPELMERGEKDKAQGVINHTFKVTMALVVIVTLLSILFSSRISDFLTLDKEFVWIIIALFVTNTTGNYFKNIFFGLQNMKKIFITNFFGQMSRLVVTLVLIYMGFSHFGALAGIFSAFFIILITRIDMKSLRLSEKAVVDMRLIYKYALPSLGYLILIQLYGNTQNIILTTMTTIELSGLFGIAMTIAALTSTIPQIVSSSIFPVLSGLSASEGAREKQRYLLKLVFRYSLLVVLPVATAILMFPEYVILFVSKQAYLPATAFLFLLIPAEIINSISGLFLRSLYAIGRPKERTIAWAIIVAIYLPLTIFLVKNFSAIGLAAAYFSVAIILFAVSLIFIKRALDFKIPSYDVIRIFGSIVIPFLLLMYGKSLLPDPTTLATLSELIMGYVAVAVLVGLAMLVYAVTIIKSGALLQEDMDVLEIVSRKSPKFNKQIIGLRERLSKYANRTYR